MIESREAKFLVGLLFLCASCLHLLAGDIAVPNAGFEKSTTSKEGAIVPDVWMVGWWGEATAAEAKAKSGMLDGESVEGRRAVYIDALSEGTAGWVSPQIPIPQPFEQFKIRVQVKRTGDLGGDNPRVFVTWVNGEKYAGKSEGVTKLGREENSWSDSSLVITEKDVPEGATAFRVNLSRSSNLGGARDGGGRLYYDDLRIETVSREISNLKLQSDAPFSCWTIGEMVTFRLAEGTLPAEAKSIIGRVRDFSGGQIAEQSVTREEFLSHGWQWKPEAPGYFEVEFAIGNADKEESPLVRSYSRGWRTDPKGPLLMAPFQRAQFNVAVTARPVRTREERLSQFGFVALVNGSSRIEDDAPLADWMGMGFARIHGIFWGGHWTPETSALEPERGVFKWERLDNDLAPLRKFGFELVGNIYGTPQWASPHPEDTKLNICVRGFEAYAPVDMEDWRNFLRKLVERYGREIKTWEIWNEPHLPGGSVFWNDTPENYVALLKAAYQTIKEAQPDSEIWIGGMAHRYLPFYKAILALGAAPYFDRLAIHGAMQGPEGFQKLDEKAGVKPKPWVDSEWHAILVGTSEIAQTGKVPSELELSRRMMLDLLYQLKYGVERTAIFQFTNKWEVEMLADAKQRRWYGVSAGLFRKTPSIEPRLAAVVYRSFLDLVDQKVEYRAEYDLGDGQKAVRLETGGRQLICFWSANSTPSPMSVKLKKAISPMTKLINWVGTPVSSTAPLDPLAVYWLVDADGRALGDDLQARDVLLSKDGMQRQDYNGPSGVVLEQSLFTKVDAAVDISEKRDWIEQNWVLKGAESGEAPSARFAVGAHDENGLDLLVEVRRGNPKKADGQFDYWWKGNGIQFALGTDSSGLTGEQVEFRVTETANGLVLTKELAPYIGGDLPAQWTPPGEPLKHGTVAVEHRSDGTTVYKVRIAWGEFYPFMRERELPLPFALVVKTNGAEGKCALEWGSGISGIKNPALYGSLKSSSENPMTESPVP